MSTEASAPASAPPLSPHDAAAAPIKVIATVGCAPGHANVVMCLTNWAPGCADMPVDAHARWRTWLNASPRFALAETLALVRRSADEVAIAVCSAGYIEIRTADPGASKPLAYVWDVTPAAAEQARVELDQGMAP